MRLIAESKSLDKPARSLVQSTFYRPGFWKGAETLIDRYNREPKAYFQSYYTTREDDNELYGYASASISVQDIQIKWLSKDMRLSRAAALSEMLTRRILFRNYYHLSDTALLTRLLNHPRAEMTWGGGTLPTETTCEICGWHNSHYICKTPYGEAHLSLENWQAGYKVLFNGQVREQLNHKEASQFILTQVRELHRQATESERKAA